MSKFQPRAHDRVHHLRDILVRVVPGRCLAAGRTVDLSRGGVKIVTDRELTVGEEVEITWADRAVAVTLGGLVSHVRADPEGLLAGVKFHRVLSPEMLRDLRRRPDDAAPEAAREEGVGRSRTA